MNGAHGAASGKLPVTQSVRSVSGRPEGPSYCSSLSVILIKSDLAWLMVPQDKPDASDYLIHTNVNVWYFDDPNICACVRARACVRVNLLVTEQ